MPLNCDIACVRAACPDPSFLEKHEAFILTIVGVASGTLGLLLSTCLKSRCKKIKGCGIDCDRHVVDLTPEQVQIQD